MTNFTPKVKRFGEVERDKLKHGLALARQKQFDAALAEFNGAVQINPKSTNAHLAIGIIHLKQKRLDEAVASLETAMRLDPMKPQAPLKLGSAYLKQGNLDLALQHFQIASNLSPKLIQAYIGSGKVLAKQKKFLAATEQYRKALQLDPQLLSPRLRLAQIYATANNSTQALAELKHALTVNPDSWIAYAQLGRIYQKQNDYSAAIQAYQSAIAHKADISTIIRLSLVECLLASQQSQAASYTLNEINPGRKLKARWHQLWGEIYAQQGQMRESAEAFRAAKLLASETPSFSESDDFDDLLDDEDEKWDDIVANLKASASTAITNQRKQRGSIAATPSPAAQ